MQFSATFHCENTPAYSRFFGDQFLRPTPTAQSMFFWPYNLLGGHAVAR